MGELLHYYSAHRSAFSTFPFGRLLCGHRGCPLRTLYGGFIILDLSFAVKWKLSHF